MIPTTPTWDVVAAVITVMCCLGVAEGFGDGQECWGPQRTEHAPGRTDCFGRVLPPPSASPGKRNAGLIPEQGPFGTSKSTITTRR